MILCSIPISSFLIVSITCIFFHMSNLNFGDLVFIIFFFEFHATHFLFGHLSCHWLFSIECIRFHYQVLRDFLPNLICAYDKTHILIGYQGPIRKDICIRSHLFFLAYYLIEPNLQPIQHSKSPFSLFWPYLLYFSFYLGDLKAKNLERF